MSDLQTSLFGIGALVVAGVIAFNWWQERQFRRRAEAAFEREHDDVLMPATPPADDDASARIEPRLDTAPAASSRTSSGRFVAPFRSGRTTRAR